MKDKKTVRKVQYCFNTVWFLSHVGHSPRASSFLKKLTVQINKKNDICDQYIKLHIQLKVY